MTRGRGPDGPGTLRKFAALTAIVVLTPLAGCTTGGDPPEGTVTMLPGIPSSPTTAPPSPTATPPRAPASAEPTAKSAEAFVRYFWRIYNYSYQTQDAAILRAISSRQCVFCKSALENIANLKRQRAWTEGAEVHLEVVVAPPGEIKKTVILATVITQTGGRTISMDGTLRTLDPVPAVRSYVGLYLQGRRWKVDGVTIEKAKLSP